MYAREHLRQVRVLDSKAFERAAFTFTLRAIASCGTRALAPVDPMALDARWRKCRQPGCWR